MKNTFRKANPKKFVENTSQPLVSLAEESLEKRQKSARKRTSKRFLWLLFIAVFFSTNFALAQQGRRSDRIHAIKVGYLTDRLNLSAQQATQFWPVYNQYENDKNAARRAFREKYQKGKDAETLDNPGQYIDDNLDYQQQLLDLNKSYKDAFLKVISTQQLASLYQAERDFKKLLLQQLRNRRERN